MWICFLSHVISQFLYSVPLCFSHIDFLIVPWIHQIYSCPRAFALFPVPSSSYKFPSTICLYLEVTYSVRLTLNTPFNTTFHHYSLTLVPSTCPTVLSPAYAHYLLFYLFFMSIFCLRPIIGKFHESKDFVCLDLLYLDCCLENGTHSISYC